MHLLIEIQLGSETNFWRKIDSNYHILYCKYNRLPIIILPHINFELGYYIKTLFYYLTLTLPFAQQLPYPLRSSYHTLPLGWAGEGRLGWGAMILLPLRLGTRLRVLLPVMPIAPALPTYLPWPLPRQPLLVSIPTAPPALATPPLP